MSRLSQFTESCSASSRDASPVSVRSVLVLSALAWPASALGGQVAPWTLVPSVKIGEALDAETGLTRVGHVVHDRDRILVSQPDEHHVRIFSRDGTPLGIIGRRGQGPGEFEEVSRVGLHGDQIWVSDGLLGRVSFFDSAYEYVSSVSVRGHPTMDASRFDVRAVLADGSLFAMRRRSAVEASDPSQPPQYVFRLHPGGVLRDTVTSLPGLSPVAEIRDGLRPQRRVFVIRPIVNRSLWSAVPDGTGFVIVHQETMTGREPHTYSVTRFGDPADTVFTRSLRYRPVPVPDDWLRREVDKQVRTGEGGGGGSVADVVRFRRAVREAIDVFDFFPPVAGLHAAADGLTWLKLRTGGDSFDWAVLDETGREIRRVRAPAGLGLASADRNGAWFVEHDHFDIPYLVRYDFPPP